MNSCIYRTLTCFLAQNKYSTDNNDSKPSSFLNHFPAIITSIREKRLDKENRNFKTFSHTIQRPV